MESRIAFAERLHLDVPLLLGVLLLSAFGLVALHSAGGQDTDLVVRQAIRLAVGFGLMFIFAQIAPRRFFAWAPMAYLVGVLLLCAVLVVGETAQGARRWLRVGTFSFQPSEFVKLTVPLMVAWFISWGDLPPRLWRVVLGGLFTLVPVVLIMRQPDLGTSLLIFASGAFVLFLAGVGWRYIMALAASGAACVPLLWHFMHDYQRQRVLTLLDPQQDPLGAGYHIIQSTIAIGSGGIYGKGWFNGTQSQLDFLPERSTDFVFAVIGEEFGLLGALVLLAVYLFIVYRGLYIAARAKYMFGKLLAGALVLTFFIYVFVNIGMVSGILPVVGLPLPLVSYGGTSMVTLMAGFGIVMSVHTHRMLLSP
ncbi:MAG: rod shape-determining protein RodA [Thiotrichales bacterium]|nr:rod shape-determining protein RodA [Thiotrichales bacterium]MCY4351031.1 rod shape-determining protein RodA [Thiotrichales bacterium]